MFSGIALVFCHLVYVLQYCNLYFLHHLFFQYSLFFVRRLVIWYCRVLSAACCLLHCQCSLALLVIFCYAVYVVRYCSIFVFCCTTHLFFVKISVFRYSRLLSIALSISSGTAACYFFSAACHPIFFCYILFHIS